MGDFLLNITDFTLIATPLWKEANKLYYGCRQKEKGRERRQAYCSLQENGPGRWYYSGGQGSLAP
jgi:hypothetical protein